MVKSMKLDGILEQASLAHSQAGYKQLLENEIKSLRSDMQLEHLPAKNNDTAKVKLLSNVKLKVFKSDDPIIPPVF